MSIRRRAARARLTDVLAPAAGRGSGLAPSSPISNPKGVNTTKPLRRLGPCRLAGSIDHVLHVCQMPWIRRTERLRKPWPLRTSLGSRLSTTKVPPASCATEKSSRRRRRSALVARRGTHRCQPWRLGLVTHAGHRPRYGQRRRLQGATPSIGPSPAANHKLAVGNNRRRTGLAIPPPQPPHPRPTPPARRPPPTSLPRPH